VLGSTHFLEVVNERVVHCRAAYCANNQHGLRGELLRHESNSDC
jgi:hypothetical protein